MIITIATEGNKAWLLDVEAIQLNIRMMAATLIRHSRLCGWLAAEHGYLLNDLRSLFSRISRTFYSAWKYERVPDGLKCNKRFEIQYDSESLFPKFIAGDASIWDEYESAFMLIMVMFIITPRFLDSTYSRFAVRIHDGVADGYRSYLKEHGLMTEDLRKQLNHQIQDAGREYDVLYRRRHL